MRQSEAQILAYETLLKQASTHHWQAVYEMLLDDGFLPSYDYVELLRLWEADSWLAKNLARLP